jgi:Flp pilus assembly protein TadG
MSRRRNDQGQSLVEWALILPLFILMFFGMVELGQIYSKQHIINQVAKELTRTATIGNSTESIRLSSIEISKSFFNAQSATVTEQTSSTTIKVIDSKGKALNIIFEPSLANRKKNNSIKVTASFTYIPITPFMNLTQVNLKGQYYSLVEVTPK